MSLPESTRPAGTMAAAVSSISHHGPRPRRVLFPVALAIVVAVLAACASTQYQALGTCDALALGGARAFGIYYQAHKAEDPALWADRYAKASAAFESYKKIGNAAQAAMESGGNQTLLLAAVNEALDQYLALLATFGVKP